MKAREMLLDGGESPWIACPAARDLRAHGAQCSESLRQLSVPRIVPGRIRATERIVMFSIAMRATSCSDNPCSTLGLTFADRLEHEFVFALRRLCLA